MRISIHKISRTKKNSTRKQRREAERNTRQIKEKGINKKKYKEENVVDELQGYTENKWLFKQA